MANQDPIILVHGLFGWGPDEMNDFSYWGAANDVRKRLGVSAASVGPISSAHDRACELFAQIAGKQVDYGEQHAREAGHARNGKDYTDLAIHKDWSEQRPIHLVGHSFGGPTILKLQQLLADDHWGLDTNTNWIKSVTGISAVYRGSTLTYQKACDIETGEVKNDIGKFMTALLKVLTGLGGERLKRLYDFDLGHWNIKAQTAEEKPRALSDWWGEIGQMGLFKARSKSDKSSDNAIYDMTQQGIKKLYDFKTNPGTYYFSYTTERTWQLPGLGRFVPNPTAAAISPLLFPSGYYIGKARLSGFLDDFNDADWWPNDGAVSVCSQLYPYGVDQDRIGGEIDEGTPDFEPGRWYWQHLKDRDHLDVAMLPKLWLRQWQRDFYTDLFARLRALP